MRYTIRKLGVGMLLVVALSSIRAQSLPRPDWRRIGNAALDLSLSGAASGPVVRVWYTEDGSTLYARNLAGRTFQTRDFENWDLLPASLNLTPPVKEDLQVAVRPEVAARVPAQSVSAAKIYAVGRFVYMSEDGGRHWGNLTAYRGQSILGDGVADVAVSPRDLDEVVVAAGTGVWRSLDGGLSWTGLNQSLPNLAARRILGFPLNARGVRISVDRQPGVFEWAPGEKQSWRPVDDASLAAEAELRRAVAEVLEARITAVASSGDYVYAGSADGQLWASSDKGRTWRKDPENAGAPVEQITLDSRDPRLALAALGARLPDLPAGARSPRLIRILNAGAFWDDLTANLPDTAVHGVAADRTTGAVYIATDRGLFMAFEDLVNAAPAASWIALGAGLPEAAAMDVRLDPGGNQLFVAMDGYGVYAAPAPHRFRDVRIVNAGDLNSRAAAPGSLLSVLGANVRSAQIGTAAIPVLASSDAKSEIQVPFEARGTSLALALESTGGLLSIGVPLQSAAPAIFVDRDGTPLLLDADSGVMLDAMTPAHSNARLQVLAAGLGQVKPDWPTGMPAPADNPPKVTAQVRAYLDRSPVEVTRAVLAPGYVGFYLIEIQLPKLVNYGPAELYLEVDGQLSNRVRVYIEP